MEAENSQINQLRLEQIIYQVSTSMCTEIRDTATSDPTSALPVFSEIPIRVEAAVGSLLTDPKVDSTLSPMWTKAAPEPKNYVYNAIVANVEAEIHAMTAIRASVADNSVIVQLYEYNACGPDQPKTWDEHTLSDLKEFLLDNKMSFSKAIIIPSRAQAAAAQPDAAQPAEAQPAAAAQIAVDDMIDAGAADRNLVKLSFAAVDSTCATHLVTQKTMRNLDAIYRFIPSKNSDVLTLSIRVEDPNKPSRPLKSMTTEDLTNLILDVRSTYGIILQKIDKSGTTYANFSRRIYGHDAKDNVGIIQVLADGLPQACAVSRIVTGGNMYSNTIHISGFRDAHLCTCELSLYARHTTLPAAIITNNGFSASKVDFMSDCDFIGKRLDMNLPIPFSVGGANMLALRNPETAARVNEIRQQRAQIAAQQAQLAEQQAQQAQQAQLAQQEQAEAEFQ